MSPAVRPGSPLSASGHLALPQLGQWVSDESSHSLQASQCFPERLEPPFDESPLSSSNMSDIIWGLLASRIGEVPTLPAWSHPAVTIAGLATVGDRTRSTGSYRNQQVEEPRRDGEEGGRLWWQARRERARRVRAWRFRTRQPERTAYHEAGHAVMARRMGLGVEYLTIRPDPEMNLLGSVEYRRVRFRRVVWRMSRHFPGRERRRLKVSRAILRDTHAVMRCSVAGSVAERIRFGPGHRYGGSGDRRQFHEHAKRLYGRTVQAADGPGGSATTRVLPGSRILDLRRLYEEDCRRTFSQPGVWNWVEAVAQTALNCTTLSGGAIETLRPNEVTLTRTA